MASETKILTPVRWTPRQGQYLAFIYDYTKVNRQSGVHGRRRPEDLPRARAGARPRQGCRAHAKGVVRTPLAPDDEGAPEDACTRYRTAALLGAFALLRVTLETGSKHQIRRHLQSVRLPVVGASSSTTETGRKAGGPSAAHARRVFGERWFFLAKR